MIAELERLSGLAELSPLEYVAEFIAAGNSLAALAESIGCPRPMLSTYVNGLEGAQAALSSARIDSGEAHVEAADKLLADCPPERESIALVREKVSLKLWRAERADARLAAAKPTVAVQVNIGRLHIDAMQAAKRPLQVSVTREVSATLDVSPAPARVSLEPPDAPKVIAPLIAELDYTVSDDNA